MLGFGMNELIILAPVLVVAVIVVVVIVVMKGRR